MATPDFVRGSYFDVYYGDGGSPEMFTLICGLRTKSFSKTANTGENYVADCADPESQPDRVLVVTGRASTITGEGIYNRAQADIIDSLHGVPTNYRFAMSEPAGDAIADFYYEGSFVMTSLEFGGGDATSPDLATVSMTFESTGPITKTDVV